MEKEYRLYSFVLRQLNPIQKGIQSSHSIVEYMTHFWANDDYHQWSTKDKTIIMLDGGTLPDMYNLIDSLRSLDVNFSTFKEPDLGDIVTSISIIVSNDVWDNPYYTIPDYIPCTNEDKLNYNLYKLISSHRLSQ